MKIVSIQTGRRQNIELKNYDSKNENKKNSELIETGIFKNPVSHPIYLDFLGLEGDEHVQKAVHGGVDRALYAFSLQAYVIWESYLPKESLKPGFFGENVTLEDLKEFEINMGDTFTLGNAVLQATMPRFPCAIFAAKAGLKNAAEILHNTKRPGVLFRVLKPGIIQIGDQLLLQNRSKDTISMVELFEMARGRKISKLNMARLQSLPNVPEQLLKRFSQWQEN